MGDQEIGQSDVLRGGGGSSSSTGDDGDDAEWEAFDAAFRGKTAAAAEVKANIAEEAATTASGRPSNVALLPSSPPSPQPPPSLPPSLPRPLPPRVHRDKNNDQEVKNGENRPAEPCMGEEENDEQERRRPFLPRGGGRGFPPFANTTHRSVDFFSGSTSSSSIGGGGGGSSTSSRSIGSATSSSAEDMRLLAPSRRRAGARERFFPSSAFAPGYEGGGGGGGGGGVSVVATDWRVSHHHHQFTGGENSHFNVKNNGGDGGNHDDDHLPLLEVSQATQQPARRFLLSAVRTNTNDATPTVNTRAQHQHQQHDEPQYRYQYTDVVGGGACTASTSRLFAWFVLLHGCLCEAPLAVLEGLVRGPLYLVAAAWIAIVGLVGASSRHAEPHRAALYMHAAALAREGILLLLASLTLAVPLSTSFTVYGEVIDRAEEDAWDARPIPTVLGAVDPLRFFVFAFGQAGELAANGRPEPLHRHHHHHHHHPTSRLVDFSPPPPSSSSFPPFWQAKIAAAGGDPADGSSGDFTADAGAGAGGRRPDSNNKKASSLQIYSSPAPAPAPAPPPVVSCIGVVTAQSMDTDRLGVGILHPPQEVGLKLRRGSTGARRAVVSAYRRLATSAAARYRRLEAAYIGQQQQQQ